MKKLKKELQYLLDEKENIESQIQIKQQQLADRAFELSQFKIGMRLKTGDNILEITGYKIPGFYKKQVSNYFEIIAVKVKKNGNAGKVRGHIYSEFEVIK